MKLYTEEQVRGAHIKGILKGRAGTTIPSSDLADLYISELTPIELPSDEEIEEKSSLFYPTKKVAGYMSEEDFVQYAKKESFEDGAKWMKEQILNQNNNNERNIRND